MDEAIASTSSKQNSAIEQDQHWLNNYALVIEQQKIVDILPQTALKDKYPGVSVEHLSGMVLMPGFINAHCHAAMSLLRGISDDRPLMEWLEQSIWPIEANVVDEDFVYQGTELAIAEMLRSGTTCFQDMYFMPDQIAKAVQQSGIRANIGLMVVDSKNKWADNAKECISKGLKVFDQYKHDSRLSFSFAPHAPYTVCAETLAEINSLSFELSLNIQMHVHETHHETETYESEFGVRPLEKLQELEMLTPQFSAIHMTQLNPQEIDWLVRSGTNVVHCPQSNLKLASGYCPINHLLSKGVNVALGTDGAASNNDLDMMAELQTAALLAKGQSGSPQAITAYQALSIATVGGARALGIEEQVGTLTIGKQADIIAIDLNQIETQPVYNPISQIAYSASRSQVRHVWVAGKQLLKNRSLTTLNEKELLRQAKAWQTRIKGTIS
jgi:5-methylthioadenosine/S-adenosylhomocysteine deaminase